MRWLRGICVIGGLGGWIGSIEGRGWVGLREGGEQPGCTWICYRSWECFGVVLVELLGVVYYDSARQVGISFFEVPGNTGDGVILGVLKHQRPRRNRGT